MERIKKLLKEAGISDYIIYGYRERTAELFFVKRQLDTRRLKDVEKFKVTVFRTDEKDGKKLRAATDVTVLRAGKETGVSENMTMMLSENPGVIHLETGSARKHRQTADPSGRLTAVKTDQSFPQ